MKTKWIASVAALALTGVACTSAVTKSNPNAAAPAATALRGGLAGFDAAAVSWNSYWYSRYNLGNLVMMSGLGVPFMPDMKDVAAMVRMVDRGPASGEHVTLPKNPALLQAVFAGGDPTLANAFNGDPGDFANWRWKGTTSPAITPSATAQTIIKEVEWAKAFNSGGWAGKVTDSFGAMDRFKGIVLFAEAKMQVAYALKNLRAPNGLFVAAAVPAGNGVRITDPATRIGDQLQMLQAIADVHQVLHNPERFNSVYGDEAFHKVVAREADALVAAVASQAPESIRDLGLGTQAVTWYAAVGHDAGLRARALELLRSWGDRLVASKPGDAVERAQAIRGLLETGRILGDARYLDAAAAAFRGLAADYDPATGYFHSRKQLSVWEVGDIIGALNGLGRFKPVGVEGAQVSRIQVGFFEAAINRSGLQQSAPPKDTEASPFEQQRVTKDLFFAYPGIPTPDKAGRAAVNAAAIGFDEATGRWSVTDPGFDTAGSMHAANEQLWIFGLADGFPEVAP